MNLCRHCGVEVEEGSRRCPLCREPLPPWTEADEMAPVPQRRPGAAGPSIRRCILEIFSIAAVTGSLVVVAADLGSGMSLSWSRYPLVFIAFTWLSVVMASLLSRRTWIFVPAQTAAVCLFLFSLDRLTPGPDWFLPLALPVTLMTGAVLALTLASARKFGLAPFSCVIAGLVAAGVLAAGLELFINSHFDDRLFLSWSAVAFGCMLLLVLLLVYLRRWFRTRRDEIRKLLHR